MKEFTYTITDPQGIHARPAGLLVKEAKKYASSLTIAKGSKKGDLKKIFTVMGLGVKQGESITVQADGADEEAAASAMETFFKENF
ncbi:HPr family phosphocarrier protein [Megasphaera hexanoica]|jgi:phosphocarrier protein|uniref:HPr family phosphocarrier protein n=1 Tax=Megasphaera hexanoica TaxID=1675036 RepID=A0ABW7DSJ1_9FIRM|nr:MULTISPECIES: HPr family phosphocarrier protein [Megasphaera]AXB81109.1 PTS galactitol transporter subunit IIC [Megasphaera hexanoica]KUH56524.1 PTS galactitol transporter subunit IIC [Megasphaera sp. DJF_B143]